MPNQTNRPIAPGMEPHIGAVHNVLDHGFIRVVDYMGNDDAVVQAARVSYGQGTKSTSSDEGLIRYLMRHRHSTPFEMCEVKLHVKLPIFVARQWVRHRTANINEISARYSILDREFYIPEAEHIAIQSTSNKQGRGEAVSPEWAAEVQSDLRVSADVAARTYDALLNDPNGEAHEASRPQIARELARTCLPVSTYTQWFWKTDLHNLFHFLSLRADPHAQYEIRAYAETLLGVVRDWVPTATKAFEDYRLNAVTLSAGQLSALRDLASSGWCGGKLDPTTGWAYFMRAHGINERELRDLLAHFGDDNAR